jgi:hypothetical protein
MRDANIAIGSLKRGLKRGLITLLFIGWIYPAPGQNFKLNIGGSSIFFPNINDHQVFFNGLGFSYNYSVIKLLGFHFSYNYYFPVTYYGKVHLLYEDIGVPVYITGPANSSDFGLHFRLFDPPSGRLQIYSTLSLNVFNHTGTYNKDPVITFFGGWSPYDIATQIVSVNYTLGCIFKIHYLPLFVSISYNQVMHQEGPDGTYWKGYSVPFSDSWMLQTGLSFPILRGPTASQIKDIKY